MNKNKNFLRFMGYQKQAVTISANQAHGSGNAVEDEAGPLTTADFGNKIIWGTAGTDLIVTVTAIGNNADGRGTKYTKDAVTGSDFAGFTGNTDTHDVAAGDVTRLHSADVALHASDGTLSITPVSGANGYDLVENDIVTVYSYLGAGDASTFPVGLSTTTTAVASTAFTKANGIILPAANYLGADAISNTRTQLSFKSTAGTATDDTIVLKHTSGKFKEVCQMMESAINADTGGRAITITDYANGINYSNNQFDLGITECAIIS
jgi:hypothetical protein